MQSFEELEVWRRSMDLAEATYVASNRFPADEKYNLTDQVRRSALSVPSNIAEGRGRGTDREFRRFLRIAYASTCELKTQALLAVRLGYGRPTELDNVLRLIDETARMLNRLIHRVSEQGG